MKRVVSSLECFPAEFESLVCKDLEDALKPFSKTNTYRGITSLCGLLGNNVFYNVFQMVANHVFPEILLSVVELGKMISLSNRQTLPLLGMCSLSPCTHSQAKTAEKTSSSAVCWTESLH